MGLIASLILDRVQANRAAELRASQDRAAGLLADRFFAPQEFDEDAEQVAQGGLLVRAQGPAARREATLQFVGEALRNEATRPAALSVFNNLIGEDRADQRQAGSLQQQWELARLSREQDQEQFDIQEARRSMVAKSQVRANRARERAALRNANRTGDGGVLVATPDGPRVTYERGHEKYNSAYREVRNIARQSNVAVKFRTLLDQTDNWGVIPPETVGEMRQLRDQIVRIQADMTNRGVLQESEAAEVARILEDPTQLVNSPKAYARLRGALRGIEDYLADQRDVAQQLYGHYPDMDQAFGEFEQYAAPAGPGPGPAATTFQDPGAGLTPEQLTAARGTVAPPPPPGQGVGSPLAVIREGVPRAVEGLRGILSDAALEAFGARASGEGRPIIIGR